MQGKLTPLWIAMLWHCLPAICAAQQPTVLPRENVSQEPSLSVKHPAYSILPEKRLYLRGSLDGVPVQIIKELGGRQTFLYVGATGNRVRLHFAEKLGLREILGMDSGLRVSVATVNNERIEYRFYRPGQRFLVGSVLYRKGKKWQQAWMLTENFSGYGKLIGSSDVTRTILSISAQPTRWGIDLARWLNLITFFPAAWAQNDDEVAQLIEKLNSPADFFDFPQTVMAGAALVGGATLITQLASLTSDSAVPALGRVAATFADITPQTAAFAAATLVAYRTFAKLDRLRQARASRLSEEDLLELERLEKPATLSAASAASLSPAPSMPKTSKTEPVAAKELSNDPATCGYSQRISGKCEPEITRVTPRSAKVGVAARFVASGRYLYNGLEVFLPHCSNGAESSLHRSRGDGGQQEITCVPNKPGTYRGTWSGAAGSAELISFLVDFEAADDSSAAPKPAQRLPPTEPSIKGAQPRSNSPVCPGAIWKYHRRQLHPTGQLAQEFENSEYPDATVPRSRGSVILKPGIHRWNGGTGDAVEQDLGYAKVTVTEYSRSGNCEAGAKIHLKYEERNKTDGHTLTTVEDYVLVRQSAR